MASALNLCGVKANLAVVSCQPQKQQIGFAAAFVATNVLPTTTTTARSRSFCAKTALRVTCKASDVDVLEKKKHVTENGSAGGDETAETSYTCVMKFGGSSVASSERMKEVANLVLSFPEERPIVVLSAMGKTTNKLLLVLTCLPFFFSFFLR